MKKKIVLVIWMCMFVSISFAQESVKNKQFNYCELACQKQLLSNKVKCFIDYGQQTTLLNEKRKMKLKDEEGKIKKFESNIDALNYLGLEGWEVIGTYYITIKKDSYFVYLLKQEVK
jgi:hypothetical protein